MGKIRIGVLGATRGIDLGVNALAGHPYAELAAICESYAPLRERVREELAKKGTVADCVEDFDQLLKCDIDAVIIANFANEHAPYAIKALNAGKHVLSEVLPTQTPAEAVALCEAVERSGKIYNYAENYCFFNQNFEMRLRYERGDIGELVDAECDFINDCSGKWHLLTRGGRGHWRNFVPSTFYCTHSIGPMLYISGQRPKFVVGMETPRLPYMAKHGARSGSAAMEIMQLENGAMAKSLNGNLKRPYHTRCRMIGTKGCLEADASVQDKLHVYIEGENETSFSHEEFMPETFIKNERTVKFGNFFQNGSYYPVEFFIGSILGEKTALKYAIDVYQSLDMALPGLFAFRSILQGSIPLEVPNFRDKQVRGKFRNDNSCTDPKIAKGDELLPSCKEGFVDVPEEIYEREAAKFEDSLKNSFHLGSN